MKKFTKKLVLIFSLFIFISILIILLLYSPIKGNIINNNISTTKILTNSLNNVNLTNGGKANIKFNDIENLFNNKLSNTNSNFPITLKKIKLENINDNSLKFIGYTDVKLFNTLFFPISYTFNTSIKSIDEKLNFNIKDVKVGKIRIPNKIAYNIIFSKLKSSSILDRNFIMDFNEKTGTFSLDTNLIFSNFDGIADINSLEITDDGVSFFLLPNNIISSIIEEDFKNSINIINKDLTNFENSITSESKKEISKKTREIVLNIQNNQVDNITASQITDIIDDLDTLSDSSKEEFIEIFSKNIDKVYKDELIKSFKNVFSENDFSKIKSS